MLGPLTYRPAIPFPHMQVRALGGREGGLVRDISQLITYTMVELDVLKVGECRRQITTCGIGHY